MTAERIEPGCDDDTPMPPGFIDELKRLCRERDEKLTAAEQPEK